MLFWNHQYRPSASLLSIVFLSQADISRVRDPYHLGQMKGDPVLGAKSTLLTLHYETSHSFPVRLHWKDFTDSTICQWELQNLVKSLEKQVQKLLASRVILFQIYTLPVIGMVDLKMLLSVIFCFISDFDWQSIVMQSKYAKQFYAAFCHKLKCSIN